MRKSIVLIQRWAPTVLEVAGVGLLAVAVGRLVVLELGVGVVGLYLLVTGIAQGMGAAGGK
jgi:hypothetical protein